MKSRMYLIAFACGAVLAFVLSFISLPYYVTKPGMAQGLASIIEVEGGNEEEGSLMLTTVRMGRATPLSYALAHIQDFQEVYPMEDIKQEGESDDQYAFRQLHMMETSKEAAIYVAYKRANKEVVVKNKKVLVMGVVPGMPAEGKLQPGDRLYKIDDQRAETHEQLISYIAGKKPGDKVKVEFEREGKKEIVVLSPALFPNMKGKTKTGLGILLDTDYEIQVKPEVHIDTNEIGGPSAGLMFSLEIYNQLVEEDITRGYKIAGTGTLDNEGHVGTIGGITQKIVAADRSGADIFLAPNESGKKKSNYREALETAREIKSEMKIVPVDTFDEALHYLQALKRKE